MKVIDHLREKISLEYRVPDQGKGHVPVDMELVIPTGKSLGKLGSADKLVHERGDVPKKLGTASWEGSGFMGNVGDSLGNFAERLPDRIPVLVHVTSELDSGGRVTGKSRHHQGNPRVLDGDERETGKRRVEGNVGPVKYLANDLYSGHVERHPDHREWDAKRGHTDKDRQCGREREGGIATEQFIRDSSPTIDRP
jgi:hypothetical protein